MVRGGSDCGKSGGTLIIETEVRVAWVAGDFLYVSNRIFFFFYETHTKPPAMQAKARVIFN